MASARSARRSTAMTPGLGAHRARGVDGQGPARPPRGVRGSFRGSVGALRGAVAIGDLPSADPRTFNDDQAADPEGLAARPGDGRVTRRARAGHAPRPGDRSRGAGARSAPSRGTGRSTRSTTWSSTRCTATSASTTRSCRRCSNRTARGDRAVRRSGRVDRREGLQDRVGRLLGRRPWHVEPDGRGCGQHRVVVARRAGNARRSVRTSTIGRSP